MANPAPSPAETSDAVTRPASGADTPGSPRRRAGVGLGLGRVALGVTFWLAPVTSVRVAGLARSVSPWAAWLARMTAARDVALGAGAAVAAARPDSTPAERAAWYLAGAVADTGDAVSMTRGIREGRLARLPALGASSGAALAAVAGLVLGGRELLAARQPPPGHASYGPR